MVVIALPAAASGAPPKTGTYVSTGDPDAIQVEIVKRKKGLQARLLKLADQCGATQLTAIPTVLGRVAGGSFHGERIGASNNISTQLTIDGTVTGRNALAASVAFTTTNHPNFSVQPGPVPPPCTTTASFTLRRLHDGL